MDVLALLRREARIEVRPSGSTEAELSYTLTDRGRHLALDAMHRDGYVGAGTGHARRLCAGGQGAGLA